MNALILDNKTTFINDFLTPDQNEFMESISEKLTELEMQVLCKTISDAITLAQKQFMDQYIIVELDGEFFRTTSEEVADQAVDHDAVVYSLAKINDIDVLEPEVELEDEDESDSDLEDTDLGN